MDPGQHGTLIMSRATIWDGWLLPLLQEFNYATWLTKAYCYNSGREGTEDWNWDWKFGPDALVQWNDPTNAKDASYKGYKWSPKDPSKGSGSWWGPGESYLDDYRGIAGSRVNNYLRCQSAHFSHHIIVPNSAC